MSVVSYSVRGLTGPVTRMPNSTLLTVEEEMLDSSNPFVNWVPVLWGAKLQSATKLHEENDPERKAWTVLNRRAMTRWVRENS